MRDLKSEASSRIQMGGLSTIHAPLTRLLLDSNFVSMTDMMSESEREKG